MHEFIEVVEDIEVIGSIEFIWQGGGIEAVELIEQTEWVQQKEEN